MTSQEHLIQPPRLAAWLVSLFACAERETILGDLLEEFSLLGSRSGVAVARHWYWRQAVKTVTHLFFRAFRGTPWSTSAAVAGGLLLSRFVFPLLEKAIFAVLDRYDLFEHHFSAYMFFATDGIAFAHVVASMLVGCAAALAAKGREMVATMTLVLILCAMTGTALVWVASRNAAIPWGMMPWYLADWFAILIGGIIVRESRSAISSRHSGA